MKKLLCILLITCTIIPLLVACGGGGDTVVTTDPAKTDAPTVTDAPVTTEYVELPDVPEDVDYEKEAYPFTLALVFLSICQLC